MWPQANGVVLTESLNLRQVTLRNSCGNCELMENCIPGAKQAV